MPYSSLQLDLRQQHSPPNSTDSGQIHCYQFMYKRNGVVYPALPWQTLADSVHRMHRTYATGRHSCDVQISRDALTTCRAALDLKGGEIRDDLSFLS